MYCQHTRVQSCSDLFHRFFRWKRLQEKGSAHQAKFTNSIQLVSGLLPPKRSGCRQNLSHSLVVYARAPSSLHPILGIGRATTCGRGSQKSVQYPIDLGKNRVCIPEMVASLSLHQFMVTKCCWGMKTSLSSSWICVAERRTNSPIPFPETMRKSLESCVKTVYKNCLCCWRGRWEGRKMIALWSIGV